jgi:hypothetical protein
MFKGNRDHYVEVKNYCDEYDFHMYVVQKDGSRKEIDPQRLVDRKFNADQAGKKPSASGAEKVKSNNP